MSGNIHFDKYQDKSQKLFDIVNSDEMTFLKHLANPQGLKVADNSIQPKQGDRIQITSWKTQANVKECVRLGKLPYLTISEVMPIVVGDSINGYFWSYEVCVVESELSFLGWEYKLV